MGRAEWNECDWLYKDQMLCRASWDCVTQPTVGRDNLEIASNF